MNKQIFSEINNGQYKLALSNNGRLTLEVQDIRDTDTLPGIVQAFDLDYVFGNISPLRLILHEVSRIDATCECARDTFIPGNTDSADKKIEECRQAIDEIQEAVAQIFSIAEKTQLEHDSVPF